ncbi:hypothetical protein FRC00_008449 [Tulasnella sp. 408]|nr:hypothetical protein FRC00_008449 [Tulasnella sp. 408]
MDLLRPASEVGPPPRTNINLIHLAYVSQRVPVLPPLLPDEEHLGRGGSPLDAGDIFDLPRLAKTLKLPILEWEQLKRARYSRAYVPADQESHVDDEVLGCWGTYQPTDEDYDPSYAFTPHFLHLNVQYTAVPANMSTPSDSSPFSGLAHMLSPSGRAAALSLSPSTWAEEPISPAPKPDDQLACFDGLYSDLEGKWEKDLGPTWNLIGTNMRFTRNMDLLATSILRRIFHLREFDAIPPVSYAARVREIQAELREIHGQDSIFGNVTEVIVTSDEADEKWWGDVEDLDWKATKWWKQTLLMGYGVWCVQAPG